MKVIRPCVVCSEDQVIEATFGQWDAWKAGMSVQTAMPHLSASLREVLISGICGECWDNMFGDCE